MNSLGEIECYDKSFDYQLPDVWPGAADQYRAECWPVVTSAQPVAAGGEVTVRVSIRVRGLVFRRTKETVVDSIACETALENTEPDVALRICYAQGGENIFDIAKHYHVPPAAMMKLNHLEDLQLTAPARLLVPMTV